MLILIIPILSLCMKHKKCIGFYGNITDMSLNLCRSNLEDQFFFTTCQGLLHALLPPGLRWTKI